MNSDEIWLLQLWSGVFGAALGAVAATAVALLVVSLTNRHQSVLATKAIGVQKALAEEALRVQSQHAEVAMKAQEDSWRQQFKEQRAEASNERQKAAIAEMVSCALEMVHRADEDVQTIMGLRHRMTTAWIRFSMEQPHDSTDGSDEILHWPGHLCSLALDVLDAKIQRKSKQSAFDTLNRVATAFSVLFRYWLRLDHKERLRISKILENLRLNPSAAETKEAFFAPWGDLIQD